MKRIHYLALVSLCSASAVIPSGCGGKPSPPAPLEFVKPLFDVPTILNQPYAKTRQSLGLVTRSAWSGDKRVETWSSSDKTASLSVTYDKSVKLPLNCGIEIKKGYYSTQEQLLKCGNLTHIAQNRSLYKTQFFAIQDEELRKAVDPETPYNIVLIQRSDRATSVTKKQESKKNLLNHRKMREGQVSRP